MAEWIPVPEQWADQLYVHASWSFLVRVEAFHLGSNHGSLIVRAKSFLPPHENYTTTYYTTYASGLRLYTGDFESNRSYGKRMIERLDLLRAAGLVWLGSDRFRRMHDLERLAEVAHEGG